MKLGTLDICLNVKDLAASLEFYFALGFEPVGGDPVDKFVIVAMERVRIGLYEGQIQENILNFRGEDVKQVAKHLAAKGLVFESGPESEEDGTTGATLRDPDGNLIYFNT